MGFEYYILCKRSGLCVVDIGHQPRTLISAIFWLLIYRYWYSYPIIDFQIRKGYIPCEQCKEEDCYYKRCVLKGESNDGRI